MITDHQPLGTASMAGASLGVAALLRETRIKLNRDIAVAATTLRIRQPYLQAIEDGRFQDLPGAAYAVGFVRGYAEYLGLDGNEIVRRFKQENRDLAGRAELVFPSTGSGSFIPTGALLGLAVIGAMVAYGIWYWLQDRPESTVDLVPALPERLAALIHKPVDEPADGPDQAPKPAEMAPLSAASAPAPAPISDSPPPAEPVVEKSAAHETEPPLAPPEPPKAAEAKPLSKPSKPVRVADLPVGDNPSAVLPASADAPAPEAAKPVWRASRRVQLRADDSCWIKIRDGSGQMVLSRLLKKGDVFAPPDRPGLEMTVGSAGALTILVDGRELPSLGPVGQVRKLILDPEKLDRSAAASPPASETTPQ